MRKKIIIGVIIAAVALGLWYYFSSRGQTTVISSETVQTGDIRQTIILSGEIDALEHAELRFQSGGMLSWVGVKEGDEVKKYQAIASLDKTSLRKSLEQRLNNYMTTRWDFEQTQDDNRDWEVRGMSDEERQAIERIIDKSQFGLNNAVLDVELQSLVLQYSTLTTPISGRVIQAVPNYSGVNISPSSSVYEIVNPDTIYFSVTADQTEVIDFQTGQPVIITLDSFSQDQITGSIAYISYTPDPTQSGTVYRIRVESSELTSNKQIRLGMTGDAEFVTQEKSGVLLVSNQYIQIDDDGNEFVWIDEGKNRALVTTGLENETHTEIIEGLSDGQQVYLIES